MIWKCTICGHEVISNNSVDVCECCDSQKFWVDSISYQSFLAEYLRLMESHSYSRVEKEEVTLTVIPTLEKGNDTLPRQELEDEISSLQKEIFVLAEEKDKLRSNLSGSYWVMFFVIIFALVIGISSNNR